jgi:Tfp pilus assembly protein, ATPase PilM
MNWFSRKQNTVLSIDISSAAVKLLELSKVANRYRIESYAVAALPKDAVIDKNIANVDLIADTIRAALKQSGTKLKEATIAVSGSSVMTKNHSYGCDFDA